MVVILPNQTIHYAKNIITFLNYLNLLDVVVKKNKTLSAVKCIHIPTGTKQERDSRSQSKNKIDAKEAVDGILDEMILTEQLLNQNEMRSNMVGSGMRGDKIRTYRFQEDIIIDHIHNKKYNLKKILRGNVNLIW